MTAQIGHAQVVAHRLACGLAWCEATLGITPRPGSGHALFATHNRLLSITTPEYPTAYFEIIAINSEAARTYSTLAKRWFDMDNPSGVKLQMQHSFLLGVAFVVRPRPRFRSQIRP